jgi:hypothetical protein
MSTENMPMVTVKMDSLPNFRCLLSEWKEMGGYRGFLKEYSLSIKQIKCVLYQMLPVTEYPTQAWEG